MRTALLRIATVATSAVAALVLGTGFASASATGGEKDPVFTPADAPTLLFEGTYTREFSSAPVATPRHDYNQILYRLDLDDPRLAAAGR